MEKEIFFVIPIVLTLLGSVSFIGQSVLAQDDNQGNDQESNGAQHSGGCVTYTEKSVINSCTCTITNRETGIATRLSSC
jgi:hypothetical protein